MLMAIASPFFASPFTGPLKVTFSIAGGGRLPQGSSALWQGYMSSTSAGMKAGPPGCQPVALMRAAFSAVVGGVGALAQPATAIATIATPASFIASTIVGLLLGLRS